MAKEYLMKKAIEYSNYLVEYTLLLSEGKDFEHTKNMAEIELSFIYAYAEVNKIERKQVNEIIDTAIVELGKKYKELRNGE